MTDLREHPVPDDALEPADDAVRLSAVEMDDDGEVVCDLDAHPRPDDRPKPFWFRHQGQRWQLIDSIDVDWQELSLAQGNPRLMMHVLLPEEQRASLLARKMPLYKIEKLMGDYQRHFKVNIDEAGGVPR